MMEFDSGMHSLGLMLQVFLLDLLLSGDNAIVIALACRKLPAPQMRQAILIGTGAAIGLRVVFTTMVTFLLAIPFLKLLGMVALISIAIKLLIDETDRPQAAQANALGNADEASPASTNLWATIGVIVVADVTMSLDNVVALAAVAQNSVLFLVIGLLLSVPLLMYGSLFVTALLKRYPVLIPAGGALLGWIAGDIGASDPLISDWVTTQLPGLTLAMPLACAIFVLLESRIIQENLKRFPKPVSNRTAPAWVLRKVTGTPQDIQPEPHMDRTALTRPSPIAATMAAGDPTSQALNEAQTSTPLPSSLPDDPQEAASAAASKKKIFYFLIGLITLPILIIISSIVYKGVRNNGLMPQPTQLITYECPGLQGSFNFYFRHGIETVRIQSSSGKLQGLAHNGKITWTNFSNDTAVLGFTPPQEITWDDAQSVRLNGGSFLQISCLKKAVDTATQ